MAEQPACSIPCLQPSCQPSCQPSWKFCLHHLTLQPFHAVLPQVAPVGLQGSAGRRSQTQVGGGAFARCQASLCHGDPHKVVAVPGALAPHLLFLTKACMAYWSEAVGSKNVGGRQGSTRVAHKARAGLWSPGRTVGRQALTHLVTKHVGGQVGGFLRFAARNPPPAASIAEEEDAVVDLADSSGSDGEGQQQDAPPSVGALAGHLVHARLLLLHAWVVQLHAQLTLAAIAASICTAVFPVFPADHAPAAPHPTLLRDAAALRCRAPGRAASARRRGWLPRSCASRTMTARRAMERMRSRRHLVGAAS